MDKRVLAEISGYELLLRLQEIVGESSRSEAEFVALIAEVDARRAFALEEMEMPSMLAYCTQYLHLSEAEARLRIGVARASREHPVLLELLADGRLDLGGIARLAPHLTPENRDALLGRAFGQSKRHGHRVDARDTATASQLRPDRVASTNTSRRAPQLQALSPARHTVEFIADAELQENLERLQALMPHVGLAEIIEQAVTEEVERLEARRHAASKTGPAWDRGAGRCQFHDAQGRQCPEKRRLDLHRRHLFGMGGDRARMSLSLFCPAHERHSAVHESGRKAVPRRWRSRVRST